MTRVAVVRPSSGPVGRNRTRGESTKNTLIALVAAVVALPAAAITNGSADGNGHPYVGLMVAQDSAGTRLWRCSGTLLSPAVFLTGGHCTEAPAAHVEIWLDADVDACIPANGYPLAGQVGGTSPTPPQYDPNAFYLHDAGVSSSTRRT